MSNSDSLLAPKALRPDEMRQKLCSIYTGCFSIPIDETIKKYCSRLVFQEGSNNKGATRLEDDDEEKF
jgi:hypothetical protein